MKMRVTISASMETKSGKDFQKKMLFLSSMMGKLASSQCKGFTLSDGTTLRMQFEEYSHDTPLTGTVTIESF